MPFNTGCYNVPNFLFFFLHNTVTCEVILSDAWSVWIKCKCLSLQSYSHTQGLLSLVLTVLIQSYDKSNAEIVMFPDREDAHQRHVHRFERREEAAGPSGGSHWQCPGGFLYTYINIRETFFLLLLFLFKFDILKKFAVWMHEVRDLISRRHVQATEMLMKGLAVHAVKL